MKEQSKVSNVTNQLTSKVSIEKVEEEDNLFQLAIDGKILITNIAFK